MLVAVNSTFPHFPGFVVTNVPADGNCQFAALALQLEREVADANGIRQEIVEHLRTHGVSNNLFHYCLIVMISLTFVWTGE